MSGRASLRAQLSSVLEAAARSVLAQVCRLLDEDAAELRLELSRLLFANSALAERVSSLEGELTAARSHRAARTVGVQAAAGAAEDEAPESGPLTIDGIFGKDWCMNLWKDRDPHSLDRDPYSLDRDPHSLDRDPHSLDGDPHSLDGDPHSLDGDPHSLDGDPHSLDRDQDSPHTSVRSLATQSDQITVTEVKEEDFLDDGGSRQETFSSAEHEEADGAAPAPGFPPDALSEASAPVQLISLSGEAFSPHIIPIEDDDDVQFVEETEAVGGGEELPPPAPSDSGGVVKPLSCGFSRGRRRAAERSKFTCRVCSRSFFHKGTLTHHLKSHKSNFCNICKQHFPRGGRLGAHTCVPPPAPSLRGAGRSCELCGKTFANPSALRIHYNVHTGEKPHTCSLCGKGFSQKGNLKCHLRIHTGERPFCCGECGMTFTQKVNLNHHLMIHRK